MKGNTKYLKQYNSAKNKNETSYNTFKVKSHKTGCHQRSVNEHVKNIINSVANTDKTF